MREMTNSQAEERVNILLVDDSPSNLLALESILRGPDRNLIPISSGRDALRYLLDNEVAVVLLDVYMPGIDGLETAQLIRGRERSRDTPIIFLTANSTGVRHLSRGYSLGAVDYIVKPIEPEILRSRSTSSSIYSRRTARFVARLVCCRKKTPSLKAPICVA